MTKTRKLILELLIGIFMAVGLFLYLYLSGFSPKGYDIYGHLFKASFLTDSIKDGDLYPLYTRYWYNGMQLFRYWPIFTYYMMSVFQLITNNIIITYYLFLCFIFLTGYFGWCLIGNREGKDIYILIGVLWFFLPDNLRVTFNEGNLSRLMIMGLLPLFFYFYTNLLLYKKHFIGSTIMVALITSTHFMMAAMCAIVFCLYAIFKKDARKNCIWAIASFICGFLVAGILLFPGIKGGITSNSTTATITSMSEYSQNLLISLSLERKSTVNTFGFGMLIISILVLIKGKSKCGTIIGLIFFTLTSSMFIPILSQLPLSQVWWMTRFTTMGYILIMYEFGQLKLEKKLLAWLALIILGIDILVSIMVYFKVEDQSIEVSKECMLEECKANTKTRIGVVDDGFNSYLSYYFYENNIDFMQGWAIQGAAIDENIVTIAESMKYGCYNYSFKNLLELGCDTILVNKNLVSDEEGFTEYAKAYGYSILDESLTMYLLKLDMDIGTFGTNFEYENLAIGSSSIYISYLYPTFEEGYSDNINDYTYEELSQYKNIYLSNFSYSNQDYLEDLLMRLSNNGVNIFIDTTHLPINSLSISSLFDVESRFIDIEELNYLEYNNKAYKIDLPYGWYTTYLESLNEDAKTSTFHYGEQELGYISKLDNITFIGLNLPFLGIEGNVDGLLDDIFGMESEIVPYEITPIQIEYSKDMIEIKSDKEVTTPLAYQDNFAGDIEENHFLTRVNEGLTVVRISYKYFGFGLFLSLFGLLATYIVNILVRISKKII